MAEGKYCDRCKSTTDTSEWKYIDVPRAMFEHKPCGWMLKVHTPKDYRRS